MTDKTRIAAEAAARLVAAGAIVVLVPSIPLAAQALAAWPAGCPVDAAFAVCSDRTAGGNGASGLAVPASTDPGWLAASAGRVLVTAT
jgi:predicted helicase